MTDPYNTGTIPPYIYYDKKQIKGEIIAVMDALLENRALKIIPQPTRVLQKYEIIELITTENNSDSNEIINSIAYLGFIEIQEGGVLRSKDTLSISGHIIGEVLGFDETHMPNHLNVIIKVKQRKSGKDLHLIVGKKLLFTSLKLISI
jgi:hypothetical protein